MPSDVLFSDIQKEFDQTFGYVRQDIGAILNKDLRLHYTITLLACCACEMLAWHNDVPEHAIFVALLPDTPDYKRIGKTLWEALRNGLAHNFRPDTIKIGTNHWRFSISSDSAPLITGTAGDPHWIRINIREFSRLVIARVDAYERELRTSAEARTRFKERLKRTTKVIPAEAEKVCEALNAVVEAGA
jgi:hypothetical protein